MITKIFALISSNKGRRETFWALLAKLISAFSGIIILFYVPKFWGIDTYGNLALILAYISIVEIFFGNSINPAIKKEVTRHGFESEGRLAFTTGLGTKVVWFALALIILRCLLFLIPIKILNDNFFFFVLLMFLMNFWGLVVNCFEAAHKLFYEFVIYLLEYGTTILLLFYFVLINYKTLHSLLIIFIAGYALALLYGAIILKNKLHLNLKDFFAKTDYDLLKIILNRTFYLSLSSASFVLLTRIDTILLSHFGSATDVGMYNIAAELSKNATIVSIPIILGSVPLFIQPNQIKLFISTATKLIFVNTLIFFGFLIFSKTFVLMVYGNRFTEVIMLLYILGTYPLFLSLQNLSSEILILNEKASSLFLNAVIAILINITLSLCLVHDFSVYGIAFATIIAYAVWFCLNLRVLLKIL